MPVAETIGVIASIVAIVQTSNHIIGLCKFYIQAASDTPSDLRKILVEISTLKSVLESLQFLESCDHAMPALWTQLSGQDGPIEACRRSISDLEKLFPADKIPIARGQSASTRQKLRLALTSLAWPRKARRAQELLQDIIQQKTIINLALTTESIQDIKLIQKDTKEIHNILNKTQSREVYRWLEITDPSPIHNRVWKLHEPETSKWMLRLPEWNKWLIGDTRCLWIHGMPGAGKTILTSFLIKQVKEHCSRQKGRGHAYYYCYFGHSQEEAGPFLRWIIAQLCRQTESVPNLVYNLYKQGGQPSLTELLLALEQVLQFFDIAYVILDAIDESKPRQDLLKTLRDIATDARFSKICCLTTSREYIDIEETLELISYSIPMSNQLIEDDIRKHVHSNLHSSPKFQRWPVDLLDEVEDAVVDGSKGMFRWAVCQLDCLKRLKPERHIIKNALKTLPKTLDETYERIFLDIPKDEWPFVNHALQWICFHQDMYQDNHPMSMQILLAATEASTCKENPQEVDLEYDAERLRNMLGCLISVDEYDYISLAHFTVREYLESQRIVESSTAYFCIGQEEMMKEYLRILLQKAQDTTWSDEQELSLEKCDVGDTPDPFLEDFTVYCVVSGTISLCKWQKVITSEESLFSLAVDFVNPTLRHFDNIKLVCESFQRRAWFFSELGLYPDYEYNVHSWIKQPENNDAMILLHLLLLPGDSSFPVLADTFIHGKEVRELAQSKMTFTKEVEGFSTYPDMEYLFDGSLLEIMAQLAFTYHESFRWLLSHCTVLLNSDILLAFIGLHYKDHPMGTYNGLCSNYCSLNFFLSGQVNPNATGHRVTPLQIAAATLDFEGVRLLLEAGAEINATGNPNGPSFKSGSILERFNELHGLSPLSICRNIEPLWNSEGYSIKEKSRLRDSTKPEIEALLLEYGAKEFSSSTRSDDTSS